MVQGLASALNFAVYSVSKWLRLHHVKNVKPALINAHQPPKIQQLQTRLCVSDFWAFACLKFKLPPLPPPSLNQTGPLLNKNFLHMAPKSRTSSCAVAENPC